MNLSPHFTYAEAVHTNQCVANEPGPVALANIEYVADKMELVREILGKPITVNSWFRSQQVNELVGGARNSDHLSGCAVDFVSPQFGTPIQICQELIKHQDVLGYKQLIFEHTWVHISWNSVPGSKQRGQVLSLLQDKTYASGLTDKLGVKLL